MRRREGAESRGRASRDYMPHEHPCGPVWAGRPAAQNASLRGSVGAETQPSLPTPGSARGLHLPKGGTFFQFTQIYHKGGQKPRWGHWAQGGPLVTGTHLLWTCPRTALPLPTGARGPLWRTPPIQVRAHQGGTVAKQTGLGAKPSS